MPNAIESILNFVIPTLIIIVVLGFVYTKMLVPFGVADKFKEWYLSLKEKASGRPKGGIDIIYE